MFSRISRYKTGKDVIALDARGRLLQSKARRAFEPVQGRMLHTIEEGDRLDGLAAKYYGQSRDWWRICDANPEFLSPQLLIGDEPRSWLRVEVSRDGSDPAWPQVLQDLRSTPGLLEIRLGNGRAPAPRESMVEGIHLLDLSRELESALDASLAAQSIAPELAAELALAHVDLGNPSLSAIESGRWQVEDLDSGDVYLFVIEAHGISVTHVARLFVLDAGLADALNDAVYRQATGPLLRERLAAEGVTGIARFDKPINEPPREIWILSDPGAGHHWILDRRGGQIHASAATSRWDWILEAYCDATRLDPSALAAKVADTGLIVSTPVVLGRVGKEIAVPPRRTR